MKLAGTGKLYQLEDKSQICILLSQHKLENATEFALSNHPSVHTCTQVLGKGWRRKILDIPEAHIDKPFLGSFPCLSGNN